MEELEIQKFLFSLDAKLDKLDGRIENLEDKVQMKLEHMDKRIEGTCVDSEQTSLILDEIASIAKKAPSFENRLQAAELKIDHIESQLSAHQNAGVKAKANLVDGVINAFKQGAFLLIGGGTVSLIFWIVFQYLTNQTLGGK
jgi:chromosome segregation ATPase